MTRNPSHRLFPYRLDKRWALLFRLLGVKDGQGVELRGDGTLRATFGKKRVETTIDNISRTEVTGPHRWYTAVGPRLSPARGDDGITFGTNHHAGLHITFIDRVEKVIGRSDHSYLWVSVADPAALAAAIGK